MKAYLESGETITIADDVLSSGGEGEVRRIINAPSQFSNTCAKVYYKKNRTPLQERKIQYMVSNPPAKLRGEGFVIGWPLQELLDDKNHFLGFIMPLAPSGSQQLVNLTALKVSKKLSPEWHQRFDRSNVRFALMSRLKLMKNIASPVHLLHQTGKYVFCDFKPQNVLVTYSGAVTLVDMDSIQIYESDNLFFPCLVKTVEYIPPEYYSVGIGRDPQIPVNISWDYFAIGVVFYQILFGLHPYVATPKYDEDDTSNEIHHNIARNLFPFGENSMQILSYPSAHNNFKIIPEDIKSLFIAAFSSFPHKRPSAEVWGKTLYEEILKHPSLSRPSMPNPYPKPSQRGNYGNSGSTISSNTSTGAGPNSGNASSSLLNVEDKPNVGLCILSFLLPIVGWILWGIHKKNTPIKAGACSLWAWVGVVIYSFVLLPLISY